MSARKPLKKATLPEPPVRSKPNNDALSATRGRKIESSDRLRSRSAKPPNRPRPNLPRSRSRGHAKAVKNKKLPNKPQANKPQANKPQANKVSKPHKKASHKKQNSKVSNKASSSCVSPKIQSNKSPIIVNKALRSIKTPPAKPDISTKPKKPPAVASQWRRNKNKSNISRKYAKKQLPKRKHNNNLANPPPARIRSKTGPSQASAANASPKIDNRPSLKPSLSSKRSKEKEITLSLKRAASQNNGIPHKPTTKLKRNKPLISPTITLNSLSLEEEEKRVTPNKPIYVPPPKHKLRPRTKLNNRTISNPPPALKPLPAPKKSGHRRDNSIVKSIPSVFHKKKSEKTRKDKSHKTLCNFGLTVEGRQRRRGFATRTDARKGLISASCQCGGVKYELLALPQELQHCYCTMCRKMHGSAVASWCPLLENDVRFIRSGKQTRYRSSDKVTRSFCSVCGSNICLKYGFQRDTIWFTPALFDGATRKYANDLTTKNWWQNVRVLHIFCGSKCEWFEIAKDGKPQLSQHDIQTSEIHGEPRFMHSEHEENNKQVPPEARLQN